MAFTDHSHLFGSIHEDGINLVVRHLMRQRPSLFNYGTAYFRDHPEHLCVQIDAASEVREARNPLFSEQAMIPIPGASLDIGLNWCLQLTDARIDFHPGNVISLPAELVALGPQRLALQFSACVGLDCPSERTIMDILPRIERLAVGESDGGGKGRPLLGGDFAVSERLDRGQRLTSVNTPAVRSFTDRWQVRGDLTNLLELPPFRPLGTGPLPHGEMLCFCLSVFAVAHFEWGTIGSGKEPWLKVRLDGMEIVDLRPQPMEDLIECYIKTVLRLGVLPRVSVPMEAMILNITEMLKKQDLTLGEIVTLGPAPVPAAVPSNPAVEGNQLKVFINLTVEEA